jgi:hypothetical protein
MELAFVSSPRQNWFFLDLIETLRSELDGLGIRSIHSTRGFPEPREDRVYVVVPPHEYVALEGRRSLGEDYALPARSVYVCGEQPRSPLFAANVELCRRAGAVFDINPQAVTALRRHGIAAEHLPLGYAHRWDHRGAAGSRDIDVLFLGCHSLRRSRLLSAIARHLSHWRCHIHLSDNRAPNSGESPTFRAEGKWELLTRSRVVLNLHQSDEPYFEWMRALDAIHAGCGFLTEHSTGYEPLIPGTHFFSGAPESLGFLADRLLSTPGRIETVASNVYTMLREHRTMRAAVQRLVTVAERLTREPVPKRVPLPARQRPVVERPSTPGDSTLDPDASLLRRGLKDTRLDMLDLRRQLARLTATVSSPDGAPPPRIRRVAWTTAWAGLPARRVSVITALYNHAGEIGEALDSLARSRYRDFELIVVDDGSTDDSQARVRTWMERHDDISSLLVEHPVNRGLGAARNTAVDFARGELCFVLDADNTIYPRCLDALVERLDGDPELAFAYPILQAFGHVEAYVAAEGDHLISRYGWDPQWLRAGNYIDALAMLRTSVLRELGGYALDRRLHGVEDFDLWCRIADRGLRGGHVPEILARYRASPSSMLSLTGISMTSAYAALIERSPQLMAGIVPPR